MLEEFVARVNQLNVITQPPLQELIESTQESYMKLRYKIKEDIHNLSTKAAEWLKRRDLNLYQRHIPRPHTSNYQK